jgi:hypothetical protein
MLLTTLCITFRKATPEQQNNATVSVMSGQAIARALLWDHPRSPREEAGLLKGPQCRFDSDRGYSSAIMPYEPGAFALFAAFVPGVPQRMAAATSIPTASLWQPCRLVRVVVATTSLGPGSCWYNGLSTMLGAALCGNKWGAPGIQRAGYRNTRRTHPTW